jgi:hypothetical protein
MRREQFKTPDEDVAAEFERVCRLFRLALGEPSERALFDALMVEANDKGLNWVQGLEYVIQRRAQAAPDAAVNRMRGVGSAATAWRDDLRRAG